jgi:5-aminopentanamidase
MFRLGILQSSGALGSVSDRLSALDQTAKSLAGRADMLLTPELFITGYAICADHAAEVAEPANGRYARAIAAMAKKYGIAIVSGFPERHEDRIYNSALAVGPDGATLALCRKLNLPMNYERNVFAPGDRLTSFSYHGLTFGMLICYDVEFPECVRSLSQQGAQIVLVPTALTTKWTRLTRTLVPTRAFENGIFVAYANHAGVDGPYELCGGSCLVGPLGFDVIRAGENEERIVGHIDVSEIELARARLPYFADLRSARWNKSFSKDRDRCDPLAPASQEEEGVR